MIQSLTFIYTNRAILLFQENLSYISCYTLVDITATGISRIPPSASDPVLRKKRNQQRNAETLVQAISIRAQPIYLEPALISEIQQDADWVFGTAYSVPARVWLFVFGVEHPDVYQPNLGGLLDDLDGVPIITGLDESVQFLQPVFSTGGANKNIHFSAITPDFFQSV